MRSEPNIIVTCDKCLGCEVERSLTSLANGGYDDRHVSRSLEKIGWKVVGDQDICPDCAEPEKR